MTSLVPKSGRCEICGSETDKLRLSTDDQPEGPNLLVCSECSIYDDGRLDYTRLETTSPHGRFHELTAFQRDMLFVLAPGGSPSGVDVKDELDVYYGQPVEKSRLYQALNRLEEKGLVAISSTDSRTNAYRITQDGARCLLAALTFRDETIGGDPHGV